MDGCFWHGCAEHGRRVPWTGPNAALWVSKLERNADRDRRSTALAQAAGWAVVRVWEHEITSDVAAAVQRVREAGSDRKTAGAPGPS